MSEKSASALPMDTRRPRRVERRRTTPGTFSGTAIPLAARITALADVFDALTHRRPYKVAWPIDAALDEISRMKGASV